MAQKRMVPDQVLADVVALSLALGQLSDHLELHRLALLGAAHEASTRLRVAASDLVAALEPVTQSALDLEERADHLTVLAATIGRRLTPRGRPRRLEDGEQWLRKQLDELQDGGAA